VRVGMKRGMSVTNQRPGAVVVGAFLVCCGAKMFEPLAIRLIINVVLSRFKTSCEPIPNLGGLRKVQDQKQEW
jgi:hypothetical protein